MALEDQVHHDARLLMIMAVVALRYRVSLFDLVSDSRDEGSVPARWCCMYLLYARGEIGLNETARLMRKHRATIIHGAREFQKMIEDDPATRNNLRSIDAALALLQGEQKNELDRGQD